MSEMKEAIRAAALGRVRREDSGLIVGRYLFPPDFPGFAGHFPAYPLLPAVAQLLTALVLDEEESGRPCRLLAVENAKFLLQLRPGEEIRVECGRRRRDGAGLLDARLWRAGKLAASFTLQVEDAGC